MTQPCICVVPHCPRTTRTMPPEREWICGDHWKLVDRKTKFLARAYRKRAARQPGTDYRPQLESLWTRAKRQAIERAMGIRA